MPIPQTIVRCCNLTWLSCVFGISMALTALEKRPSLTLSAKTPFPPTSRIGLILGTCPAKLKLQDSVVPLGHQFFLNTKNLGDEIGHVHGHLVDLRRVVHCVLLATRHGHVQGNTYARYLAECAHPR